MRDEIAVNRFETEGDSPGQSATAEPDGMPAKSLSEPDGSNARAITASDLPSDLPPALQLLVAKFHELSVKFDPNERAVWCTATPIGPPSMTVSMISELNQLHKLIMSIKTNLKASDNNSPQFYVVRSGLKGIFNLGGDLQYFISCIRKQDQPALMNYAHACVELIYDIDQSLGSNVLTIGVVQGDALGGGLESALSFNVLIAERGSKMGLPETLFNAFPGMGAYSLLSRKIGPVEAERMIMSGKIYLAEELHEMGVVSVLAEPGKGEEAAHRFIADNRSKHSLLLALNKVRRRVVPVTYEELEEVTDIWVDNAMGLSSNDLRRMELLAQAQTRRMRTR